MVFKHLLRKEFLQFFRNSFLPRLIVIFPIVFMCVLPFVVNMDVVDVRVAVVDNDHSSLSRRLVERVQGSDYFLFAGTRPSYAVALEDIEACWVDIVMVIPPDYGANLTLGQCPQVLIAANAVNGTKGQLGSQYLSSVVMQNAQEAQAEAAGSALSSSASTLPQVSEIYLYNPNLDYRVYMVPALMGMILMLLCGFLPALNIVSEKEAGTIEQINVTPVGKVEFILAKLIPYWLIGMVVLTLCLGLAWAVHGITPAGNVAYIYLLALLLALSFSGLGLIVSNSSSTMQQAIFVIWFVVVCFILLSGLFTPVRSMPDWAIVLTKFNPMTHFMEAMRTVFVRGGGFSAIAEQLILLALCALVLDVWAILSYRKRS